MDKYRLRRFKRDHFGGRLLEFEEKQMTDYLMGRSITFDRTSDIGACLYFEGEFEKKEIEFCRRFIKEDSIVIDVGANIGIHSLCFSEMARKGVVFSFEPSPETYELLIKNISGSSNIIPVNIGVSDSKGVAEFFVASDNAFSGLKDTKRKEIKKSIKVVCFSLDDFFKGMGLGGVDFVKIDVEGLEQSVIEGMHWMMEKYHPVIFCEIYKGTDSNEDPEKTIRHIIERGYDAFIFKNDELIGFERHSDDFYNYFFLPRAGKR